MAVQPGIVSPVVGNLKEEFILQYLFYILDTIKSWNRRLKTTIPSEDQEVAHLSKMLLGKP